METLKGKEVIAYKRINRNMRCLDINCGDFKFEIGKTYKTDKAELYTSGFHAYLNPLSAIEYRMTTFSRYFKVKLSGEITECNGFDTELAATEITILEEINIDDLSKITEWWKNENVLDLLYWSDGFARVERGDTLYNYIDKQGKIFLNEWYEWLDDFFEGFAIVQREDKLYNLIDTNGKILSSEWFEFVHCFEFGYADVERTNGEQAKIDKNGKIVVRK